MSQVKRILVPTDFSETSDFATGYAIDIAFRYGASIRFVNVLEDLNYLAVYPEGYFDLPGPRQRLIDDATGRLAELVKQCETARVEASFSVLSGHAARTIVDEAATPDVDLIVMGTHGRSGFAHLFLGSVAEKVVRSAPCPVLTVRQNLRLQSVPAKHAAVRQEPLAAPLP
jgi:universal stress protein A